MKYTLKISELTDSWEDKGEFKYKALVLFSII